MTTSTTFPTIMDSPTPELKQIILHYLSRFDDYIQMACDQQNPELGEYFDHEFSQLEQHYHSISDTQTVSESQRNSIRMICKYTERLAQTDLTELVAAAL